MKSQGMEVTDDDIKTRAQKEKLDEITSEQPANGTPSKPAVERQGTMAVTAEVYMCLLSISTQNISERDVITPLVVTQQHCKLNDHYTFEL